MAQSSYRLENGHYYQANFHSEYYGTQFLLFGKGGIAEPTFTQNMAQSLKVPEEISNFIVSWSK